MPVTYKVYPEHNIVIVRFNGYVKGDELIKAYADIYSQDEMTPGTNELVFFEEDAVLDFDNDSLILVGQMTAKFNAGIHTVTGYVGNKLHQELMARYFDNLVNLLSHRTESLKWFKDLPSALEVLIPDQEYESVLMAENLL